MSAIESSFSSGSIGPRPTISSNTERAELVELGGVQRRAARCGRSRPPAGAPGGASPARPACRAWRGRSPRSACACSFSRMSSMPSSWTCAGPSSRSGSKLRLRLGLGVSCRRIRSRRGRRRVGRIGDDQPRGRLGGAGPKAEPGHQARLACRAAVAGAVSRSTSTAMSRTIFERGRWWLIEPPRLTDAAAASQSEVTPPSALRCSAFSASASEGAGPKTRLARRLRMIRGGWRFGQLRLDLGGERAGREQRRHRQLGDHQHLVGAGQHVERPGLAGGAAGR